LMRLWHGVFCSDTIERATKHRKFPLMNKGFCCTPLHLLYHRQTAPDGSWMGAMGAAVNSDLGSEIHIHQSLNQNLSLFSDRSKPKKSLYHGFCK
jgi:hypothetical protein